MPDDLYLSEARRSLLGKYLRGRDLKPEGADTISKRPAQGPAPASFSQEQVWRRHREFPHIPIYNESITVYRRGPTDVEALERAFTGIIRRHEIWRTSFDLVDGQIVQIVHTPPDLVKLPVVDLRHLPEDEREAEAVRLVKLDAQRPFDLARVPLMRPTLARLRDAEYRLCLVMHQIILDGVSAYNVLMTELAALYAAFAAGKPSPLAPLPVQCADYAWWQRQWLKGETLERQVSYWRKQLQGPLPVLRWPAERPRPAAQSFRGAIQPFTLPKSLSEPLKQLGQREGVTLFATLLAAFATLLHRYTAQTDIIIGTVAPSGRKRSEAQQLLGYFLNPVPLRLNLSENPSFRDLLKQARLVAAEAISNDDVPFEHLVRELRPAPDPSRNPFFTVAMSQEPPMPDLGPAWDLTPMDANSGGARWDLYLVLDDRPWGMLGRVQYNPDLFDQEAILRTLADYQSLLESLIENAGRRLSDLPVFTAGSATGVIHGGSSRTLRREA